MRKRYVSASYNRDLQLKLQKLTQGNKNVEEYFKDMEITIIRANIEEDNEMTMSRFLSGLNSDIKDIIELQEYVEMEDLLHKVTQVEQQLKRKSMQEETLPTLSQVGKTSPGRKDPHPSNLPRWFYMEKLQRVPMRKPLKLRM